ncbi:hypothetical protein Tco_0659615 [Tanacetum coccineum]
MVRTPYTLPPSIEEPIAEEIAAPPHERYRSPSPSSASASPSPSPLPSRKRCREPSLPPSPPVPSSPPPAMMSPRKRFRMTSPQQETIDETMTEAIIPTRLYRKSKACRWTIQIKEMQDHLEEIPLERVETVEQELETLHDRAEAAEQQIEVLHYSLGIAWERIIESHICMEDAEALLRESKNMPTTRQGLNSVVIEQLITQSVDDVMTAYEANRNSRNRVKYVACTLLDGILTWWNSYLKRIGLDAAYETTWRELKQMIIDEYCQRL